MVKGLTKTGNGESGGKASHPRRYKLRGEKANVYGTHGLYPVLKPMKAAKKRAIGSKRLWTGHCSIDSEEQVKSWVVPVQVVASVVLSGRLLIDQVISPVPEMVGAAAKVLIPDGLTAGTSLMNSASAVVVSGKQAPFHA